MKVLPLNKWIALLSLLVLIFIAGVQAEEDSYHLIYPPLGEGRRQPFVIVVASQKHDVKNATNVNDGRVVDFVKPWLCTTYEQGLGLAVPNLDELENTQVHIKYPTEPLPPIFRDDKANVACTPLYLSALQTTDQLDYVNFHASMEQYFARDEHRRHGQVIAFGLGSLGLGYAGAVWAGFMGGTAGTIAVTSAAGNLSVPSGVLAWAQLIPSVSVGFMAGAAVYDLSDQVRRDLAYHFEANDSNPYHQKHFNNDPVKSLAQALIDIARAYRQSWDPGKSRSTDGMTTATLTEPQRSLGVFAAPGSHLVEITLAMQRLLPKSLLSKTSWGDGYGVQVSRQCQNDKNQGPCFAQYHWVFGASNGSWR